MGSDEEECEGEGGSRYTHNGDEKPNPPSVEGPFVMCYKEGEQTVLPEHLNRYKAIPMPWVVSATTTTTTTTGAVVPSSEVKMGCFPMRVVDSLKASLAIYDIVQPKTPKAPKLAKSNNTASTSTSTTAAVASSPQPEATPESAAAAFAAAASIIASLQAPATSSSTDGSSSSTSTSSEPPMKKAKAELKMVTNLEHLAFLAGIIHQSDWNCDKIISTFISKYSEHSKVATKRTLTDMALHKGKSWILKPESLAKFGIEVPLLTAPVTPPVTAPTPAVTSAVAQPSSTTPISSSSSVVPKLVLEKKSPAKRKEAHATVSIIDMFARKKTSPNKKQKTTETVVAPVVVDADAVEVAPEVVVAAVAPVADTVVEVEEPVVEVKEPTCSEITN